MGGVVFPRFFRFLGGKTTKTNTKTKTKTTSTCARENPIEKESRKEIEKEIEKKPSRIEKEEAFSIFWKNYPRKDSKVPAQKAFEKVVVSEDMLQTVMAGLDKFKVCEQWVRDGGKFIPFASTWLNQRRWEDDPLPASAASRSATSSDAKSDSRRNAYEVLTGRSVARETQFPEVINGHVKFLG
ncbi:hypothetical protein [Caballeronia sp. LZ001]|uniref:hypothetical protein n=1 Tax=Caballeronia sp. LZ001 TaxID=3038553 RepID=UPI002862B9C9|nr:hypothetical protein [Caballeronia sp. LZ001]MDR5802151.1 hypothetical protein [Caballeronia sp. LZ001]